MQASVQISANKPPALAGVRTRSAHPQPWVCAQQMHLPGPAHLLGSLVQWRLRVGILSEAVSSSCKPARQPGLGMSMNAAAAACLQQLRTHSSWSTAQWPMKAALCSALAWLVRITASTSAPAEHGLDKGRSGRGSSRLALLT